jgi:hypothetical protein
MLRKFGFGLLCIAASFSSSVYSMGTYALQLGTTLEYELPNNDPQQFINYMFWTVEADCQIATTDESNDLYVKALAKKGKVNNQVLKAGESLVVTVHNGDVLRLSADSGAKVEITNLGLHTVKATCSTVSSK